MMQRPSSVEILNGDFFRKLGFPHKSGVLFYVVAQGFKKPGN